jgi:hypothetical protein
MGGSDDQGGSGICVGFPGGEKAGQADFRFLGWVPGLNRDQRPGFLIPRGLQ